MNSVGAPDQRPTSCPGRPAGWSPRRPSSSCKSGPPFGRGGWCRARPPPMMFRTPARAGSSPPRCRRRHAGHHHLEPLLGRFFTILSALRSAASTTTAVPCWSSWKTGMSSVLRSRASISKQRGARDVLEVDAAEGGRDQLDGARRSSSGSLRVKADREGVDAAELLEEQRLALHDRHAPPPGRCRPGPSTARAVGDDRHRVALDGERGRPCASVLAIAMHTRATPGV